MNTIQRTNPSPHQLLYTGVGSSTKENNKLQKMAIRMTTNSQYDAHTDPLFKSLKLIKVEDIFKLQQFKLYHKYVNRNLPEYLQNITIRLNSDVLKNISTQKVQTLNWRIKSLDMALLVYSTIPLIQSRIKSKPTLSKASVCTQKPI